MVILRESVCDVDVGWNGRKHKMEITEKCHNCHRPNLIDRPARMDVFCGWCGTEYKRDRLETHYISAGCQGNLVVSEIHNNHKEEKTSDIKSYRRGYYQRTTERWQRKREKLRNEQVLASK